MLIFKNLQLGVIALALLLLVSGFALISNLQAASVGLVENESRISSFGDLSQYEWPQPQGDSSFTRFSSGPAPETTNIMWKTNITGIQSYISAFKGKIFVTTRTSVYALDKDTGATIWNTTIPMPGRWPAVYKIDDTHLLSGGSSLDTATGRIIWSSANFSANANFFSVGVYSPEEKLFFLKNKAYIEAWDFSDPSVQPTLKWQTFVSGASNVGSGVQYGGGIVFSGSFEPHQVALNATTGKVLWDVETSSGMIFPGVYYEGKFFRGGPFDNNLYAFDAMTGEILWKYNPGTNDGYWCSGLAAAYGLIFGLNKDGHLYAVYADDGEVAWAYKGPGPLFFPGTPIVADGKVYATTGQSAAFNPSTGSYSKSEFVSLDVYTGQKIWSLPVEAYSPRESTAIAYGNLYLIPGFVEEQQMDDYVTFDQVWAIGIQPKPWPMWRHDPEHSGAGQSGPTNLTLRWKFTAGGAVVSSPSAADGIIYFGSQDKNVYAVDSWTGSLIWKFNTSTRIASSPAVVDGRVYVGPDDGTVYSLNASDGSLIWSTPAGGYVQAYFAAAVNLRSSPTVVDGKVFVGSLDKNLYSLNARNGDVEWKFQTEGYITSSPAVANGVVYVISQEPSSAGLYMLNAANGDLIRRVAIPYQLASRGTDMHASPAVANGMVFAGANKKVYYGINATTGNVTWTFRDDDAEEFIIASPIYQDGKVFLVDQFFIVAVNASTGKTIWQSFVGTEFYVSPTYADGKLYITSDQRGLYVLNATDGSKLGFFGTSSNSWSSATLYDGKAYVGNNDWNVYSIAEQPLLNSNISIELAESTVQVGKQVIGTGQLIPGKPNASITVAFIKPDGEAEEMEAVTIGKGIFQFAYNPDVAGSWTVAAWWTSDIGYYNSAYSEHVALQVENPTSPGNGDGDNTGTGVPIEYIYFGVAVAVLAAASVSAVYVVRKRRKK